MAPTNPSHTRPRSNPRPVFSPPRPGKGKEKGATKKSSISSSAKATNGVIKQYKTKASTNGSGRMGVQSRKEQLSRDGSEKSLNGKDGRLKSGKGSSRRILEEENEDDDEGEDDEEDDQNNSDDANSSQADPSPPQTTSSPASSPSSRASSPEPDYILAEITHGDDGASKSTSKSKTNSQTGSSDSTSPIPQGLLHLMLRHNFQNPESTSLSLDARLLLSKYFELFVREGIRRCAAEKSDRFGGAGGSGGGGDAGWLEVEDLEKIGVQLCLDF
ncbi:hypothetical protein PV10_03317 [Exophiala mesophila]|uniref:Uncharacterized protein n=1 Tax=Exophiala mesophila TaxID=212818 RepID=A0A0D1ZNY9_EXOME|nr:uncharacterized protein PV10_03317 [Exophiala mesophila]KIV95694.1 hypothetical protein PV10_03317 [Exophiala mesophila]